MHTLQFIYQKSNSKGGGICLGRRHVFRRRKIFRRRNIFRPETCFQAEAYFQAEGNFQAKAYFKAQAYFQAEANFQADGAVVAAEVILIYREEINFKSMNAKLSFNNNLISLKQKKCIKKYIRNTSSDDATSLLPSIKLQRHKNTFTCY